MDISSFKSATVSLNSCRRVSSSSFVKQNEDRKHVFCIEPSSSLEAHSLNRNGSNSVHLQREGTADVAPAPATGESKKKKKEKKNSQRTETMDTSTPDQIIQVESSETSATAEASKASPAAGTLAPWLGSWIVRQFRLNYLLVRVTKPPTQLSDVATTSTSAAAAAKKAESDCRPQIASICTNDHLSGAGHESPIETLSRRFTQQTTPLGREGDCQSSGCSRDRMASELCLQISQPHDSPLQSSSSVSSKLKAKLTTTAANEEKDGCCSSAATTDCCNHSSKLAPSFTLSSGSSSVYANEPLGHSLSPPRPRPPPLCRCQYHLEEEEEEDDYDDTAATTVTTATTTDKRLPFNSMQMAGTVTADTASRSSRQRKSSKQIEQSSYCWQHRSSTEQDCHPLISACKPLPPLSPRPPPPSSAASRHQVLSRSAGCSALQQRAVFRDNAVSDLLPYCRRQVEADKSGVRQQQQQSAAIKEHVPVVGAFVGGAAASVVHSCSQHSSSSTSSSISAEGNLQSPPAPPALPARALSPPPPLLPSAVCCSSSFVMSQYSKSPQSHRYQTSRIRFHHDAVQILDAADSGTDRCAESSNSNSGSGDGDDVFFQQPLPSPPLQSSLLSTSLPSFVSSKYHQQPLQSRANGQSQRCSPTLADHPLHFTIDISSSRSNDQLMSSNSSYNTSNNSSSCGRRLRRQDHPQQQPKQQQQSLYRRYISASTSQFNFSSRAAAGGGDGDGGGGRGGGGGLRTSTLASSNNDHLLVTTLTTGSSSQLRQSSFLFANCVPLRHRSARFRKYQFVVNNFLERPSGLLAVLYHISL